MNILIAKMIAHADPSQVAGLARFFKTGPGQYGEGDKFLGIKVPVTRAVVKECWKEVGLGDLEECLANEYHEIRLAGLLALVEIFKHAKGLPVRPGVTSFPAHSETASCLALSETASCQAHSETASFLAHSETASFPARPGISREECVRFYLSHTETINNWDLVDLSCYPLLGEWLLDKDRSILYDLARNGKTIWEQRIGIVSTMTFIRHGQIQDTFAIADILLHHPHDLIHKAVGWLLREAGKRDKPALDAFLKDRYQTMPRTMLRYAIEKYPEAERLAYLSAR